MARSTSLTSLRQMSEINLTPMMDLTFILLITFIITFPLIEQGIPVNLPTARAQAIETDASRTISVDSENRVYLDDVPIELDQLGAQLAAAIAQNPSVAVLVRADERLTYGTVVKVLRVLHDSKVTRMALVTQAN